MSGIKCLKSLIFAGLLSLSLSTFFGQTAFAQSSKFLLDQKCVSNGGMGSSDRNARDYSVGREIYTSLFWMVSYRIDSPVNYTCRLQGFGSASLALEFGIPEQGMFQNSGVPSEVSIYLDGTQFRKDTISRGQVRREFIDITHVKSISLEVTCPRASGCGDVHFFKAEIQPVAVSPGKRN